MFTHVLRTRVIQFKSAAPPTFPNDVVISISLKPQVPFGGVAGESRSMVNGCTSKLRVNLSSGRFVVQSLSPLFDPIEASVVANKVDFRIAGSQATISLQGASYPDFVGLIHLAYFSFPVFLNVLIPESPYALYAWGTVGTVKFQLQFHPNDLQGGASVTSKTHQEERVLSSWQRALRLSNRRRLVNGLHYFHVASRLMDVGSNRFEFMAESLQNVAKALQATFGETRDAVRKELEKLGYTTEEIEKEFVPYLVIRSEFDISHVSLSVLTTEQAGVLHEYSDRAVETVRRLFQRVLDRIDANSYTLLPDADDSLSAAKVKILHKLAANLVESAK